VPQALEGLSPRELQVLRLVARVKPARDRSFARPWLQTVRSYRKTMMKKLGVSNVAGLTSLRSLRVSRASPRLRPPPPKLIRAASEGASLPHGMVEGNRSPSSQRAQRSPASATGAGKTTRVPPALLPVTQREIWVLEPRRLLPAWRPPRSL